MDYVLKLKFKHAWKLIKKCIEENDKEKLFQLFLVERKHSLYLLSHGVIKQSDIITFNEYCERVKPIQLDSKSNEEIIEEILALKFKREE